MQTKQRKNIDGFTLIEMLLVLVIISSIIYMTVSYLQKKTDQQRLDKTALQMQQILNAGLSYYVVNSSWPVGTAAAVNVSASSLTPTYLPATLTNGPWGQPYRIISTTTNLYVYTRVTSSGSSAQGNASIIAGKLPLSYVSGDTAGALPAAGTACTATSCIVVGSVNIPGTNLNNATAVNYAGLYHHGGCVPVPRCPVDANGNTLTAQVFVIPVSVSGMNERNSSNVYPISSFTAYATGGTSTSPPNCTNGGAPTPAPCGAVGGTSFTGNYWRACLQIVTEQGDVAITNTGGTASAVSPYYPWGGNVTLLAITKCSLSNEPSGSTFSVFTQ